MVAVGKQRYVWIDCIKLFACTLVVLGHLYMSMSAGGWIPEDAVYYCLPIQAVYSFHVPLFFICSGFLYQIKKSEYSATEHLKTIKSKALSLGIPYFVFSLITLILKMIFSSEVNNHATPIIRTLFWEPIAPYWYLYTLFFIFCIIPRFRSEHQLKIAFAIAVIVKIIYVCVPWPFTLPDIIAKTAGNAIWFTYGMLLTEAYIRLQVRNRVMCILALCVGSAISLMFYRQSNESKIVQFIVAVMFVFALSSYFLQLSYIHVEDTVTKLGKYFMPVYLMHTIFAAMVRTVLVKANINTFALQFGFGLIGSIVFPIIVYEVARKYWFLQFFIEPQEALKRKGKKNVRLQKAH